MFPGHFGLSCPHATYLIDHLPTTLLNNVSPYGKLYARSPDCAFLCIFECARFPYLRPYLNNKLNSRSNLCVFTGYCSTHQGYNCLHLPTGLFFTARHVIFDEYKFYFAQKVPSSLTSSQETTKATAQLPTFPISVFPSSSDGLSITVPCLEEQRHPGTYSNPTSTPAVPDNRAALEPEPARADEPLPTTAADLPASSTIHAPPPSTSHYSIVTRSKDGICCPRVLFPQCTLCLRLFLSPSQCLLCPLVINKQFVI